LGIDLFLLLLHLHSSRASQGIPKMQRGQDRVKKQHTWSSVAHNTIELLAHIRVEAMGRANTANRLIPRLVLATVDALYSVMQQLHAFTTDFSVCMLLPMTVNLYHVLDCYLFSIDKSVGVWQDGNTSFYIDLWIISLSAQRCGRCAAFDRTSVMVRRIGHRNNCARFHS